MKILMLSWEFPPRIVGGISPHVYNLSLELSKLGVDVCVLTCDFPGSPAFETIEGVKIYRVDSYKFPAPDFTSWVFMMNTNMKISAGNIVTANEKEISLIHAHDWLVADTAIGLKHILRKPLVTTLHSTEYGRRNGINSDYQRLIHETEKWLSYESWRVICCSNYMASHVHAVLNIPNNKLEVIPNGIDAKEFNYVYDRAGFRKRFVNSTEKLVLFTGRLVHEKGVLVLIDAITTVLRDIDAKFIIVGAGYLKDEINRRVSEMGISDKVYLTGFIDDETSKKLFMIADVCVVPSLYEPFGIVALEAMAAKTPVVVSQVGGLVEIVEHDQTGVIVYQNNSESLAWGIKRVLTDERYADRIRLNAFRRVSEEYDWSCIAKKTLRFYEKILTEYEENDWKPL